MAQSANVEFQKRDRIVGLREEEGLFGRKKIVLPTLDDKGRNGQFLWVKNNRAPVDIIFRVALARLLGRAPENIAEPIEHDGRVVWIVDVEAAPEKAEGIGQLGDIVWGQGLGEIRP